LRVASSDTEAAIGNAMQAIGRFLEVERVAFWAKRGVRFELERAWVSDGAAAPRAAGTGIDASHSLFGLLQHGEVVNLADVEAQLPSGCGNRALLAIPLLDNGVVVGALSFEAMHAARSWPDTLIPRIRLIGEAFASVLAHRRAIEQVHDAQVDAAQHRERLAHMARVHTMGEMSAAIAHEVNQPLVAIENYALAARRRLASSTTSDIGKIDELLSKIRVQAARAGDVIQRLRAMVKRHEYEVAHADLGRLVTGAVELAEMESRLTGLQIRIHMACAPTPVLVDEIQIQQVVLNLIRNGIEAMASGQAEGLALTVEVTRAGEAEAVVRVIDSGPGIEPGNEERIFEPFYSTKATGLGIGLAVCRSIVESHGGRLRYAPNPGGGAAFEFTLPIADEEEEP
jgi:signal transduction histidine kinase